MSPSSNKAFVRKLEKRVQRRSWIEFARVKITAPSRLSLPVVAVFRSRRSANAVAIAIEKAKIEKVG